MPSETQIANLALGKVGGAGEVEGGNAFITSIDGTDKVSSWLNLLFPRARRKVIVDLAALQCPFRSTIRFKDLGPELASTPEIGQYEHAFNLPANCLEVVSQFDENQMATRARRGTSVAEVQWETVANASGTGKILLTNFFTNLDGTSAFIEYVIDTPNTKGFTEGMIDCIATLLASGVVPVIAVDRELSRTMLAEYITIAIPNAQAENQRGFNATVKPIPDFSGGRSLGSIFPAVATDLGTFFTAEGDRRAIFP